MVHWMLAEFGNGWKWNDLKNETKISRNIESFVPISGENSETLKRFGNWNKRFNDSSYFCFIFQIILFSSILFFSWNLGQFISFVFNKNWVYFVLINKRCHRFANAITSGETWTKLNSNLKSLKARKRHNFRSLPPRSPEIIRKTSPRKHLNDSPSHNDSFLLFVLISLHALFSTLSTFRILCGGGGTSRKFRRTFLSWMFRKFN